MLDLCIPIHIGICPYIQQPWLLVSPDRSSLQRESSVDIDPVHSTMADLHSHAVIIRVHSDTKFKLT